MTINGHCALRRHYASYGKSHGKEGTPEKESLEATSENRHRGCGRDMLGQTIASTVQYRANAPLLCSQLVYYSHMYG